MMPRLLDLFCGAGGAGVGYQRAGFDVLGVDISPQPDYPFPMFVADAMAVLADARTLAGFDVIHASPPCPRFSAITNPAAREKWPDLLAPTLDALADHPGTWVVENVPGAPMRAPVLICGAALGLGAHCEDGRYRPLRRHRLFDTNAPAMGAGCGCDGRESLGAYGHAGTHARPDGTGRGYKGTTAECREGLGVPWITRRADVVLAVPPAYTEYIGRQLLEAAA